MKHTLNAAHWERIGILNIAHHLEADIVSMDLHYLKRDPNAVLIEKHSLLILWSGYKGRVSNQLWQRGFCIHVTWPGSLFSFSRVAVVSKSFEGQTDKTEEWYGTQYKQEAISEDSIEVITVVTEL